MSYYSGIEFGKKVYFNNLQKYGFSERKHSEKVINTCRNYACNTKLQKTKNGVKLTKDKRLFYKGVADFLQAPNRIRY